MKMKKYYNFLSKRLMSIYIIYITIFSLAAYSLCLVYVRNDFRRTEDQYMETLAENLENHLLYVMDITATLTNNQNVVNFSTREKGIDYAEITKVMGNVRQTNTVNNFGSEFAVVNVNSDIAVSSEGSMSLTYFESRLGLEPNELKDKLVNLYNNGKNSIEMVTSNEIHNQKYLITLMSTKANNYKPVLYVSMYNLENLFKNIPNNNLPQVINIHLDKNDISICYNSEENSHISFTKPEIGVKYKEVSSHRTSTNFWGTIETYVHFSALSYYIYINNFFVFLLLFLIAIAFIGHLYIKSKTTQIYSPIKKMLHNLPKDIENTDDEFETVGNFFSSLVTQRNAMSDIISENRIQLRDRFIAKLMNSTLTREQIKSELVIYGLEDVSYPGVTCIVSYKNFDELKNILTIDGLGEVRDAVKDCFEKQFSTARYFKIIDFDQQTFGAIICVKDIDLLENQLKKCVLNIEMMLDINMIVFMGCKAESWYDIPASYAEATSLKNRSRIVTDQSIVVSSRNSLADNTIVYTTEQETELMNYVLAENTKMVSVTLERIIDDNLKNNYLPHDYFSQFVTMLYSTIIKILTKLNKTEKEVFAPVSVYLELMNCDNATALKATALNLFGIIISDIENMRKNTTIDSTQYILSYVNDHYAEEISLFTLAEYLNMSQSHASKTFKQTTGENFKDYLTNIRLTKAVEIMDANPYVKISDVAKSVGYSSETFTKAFTKKYNMTPSAYMQKRAK